MALVASFTNEALLYQFQGKLNFEQGQELKAQIGEQLVRKSKKFIVVIEPSNHVSLDGLQILVEIYKSVIEAGGEFVIVNIDGHCTKFHALGLDTKLTIFETRKEAFDSFTKKAS